MLYKNYKDVIVGVLRQREALLSLGLSFSCNNIFDYVKNEFETGTDAVSITFMFPNDRTEPVVAKVVSYCRHDGKYYGEFYSLISGE